MNSLVNEAYKIADSNNAILKGNIKISNNTNCLIFAHYCDSTLFYKKFYKISKDILKDKDIKTIGVTAGASTPDWIIKEVINIMEGF